MHLGPPSGGRFFFGGFFVGFVFFVLCWFFFFFVLFLFLFLFFFFVFIVCFVFDIVFFLLEALWESPWIDFGHLRAQFWSPGVIQKRFNRTMKNIYFTS